MPEKNRPVYCTQCGSIVDAGANFCGVCGTRVSSDAVDAGPPQQVPTQATPPSDAGGTRRNPTPLLILGFGLALVLVLSVGSIVGLSLVRGAEDPPPPVPDDSEDKPAVADTTQPVEKTEETTAPKPAHEESVADKEPQPQEDEDTAEKKSQPAPEEASGPSPGYNLIETPDGGLSAEVPPSWGVETGEDSEKEGTGPGSWSTYAGEYLFSSITTAPSLEVWYGGEEGISGVYFVASKALTQYSDYEVTNSLFNAGKNDSCTEKGPYDDYDRKSLSGKLQTWYGCGNDSATVYTLAAYPEGRECVVALNARVSDEAEREAIEHLVNTFGVDCGRVTSGPLTTPSAPPGSSASPSASTEPSAAESGLASAGPCPEGSMQNAAGNTCTDLETGEIVRYTPLPENPDTNPCPEMWAMNEQGRCEHIPLS